MKTMTCRQLGGTCEVAHRGATADEIIKAQDQHLREVVESGDGAHRPALEEMKGRWKHPISGMKWYRKVKRDFAATPSDGGGEERRQRRRRIHMVAHIYA
jgi:hypothetical protein